MNKLKIQQFDIPDTCDIPICTYTAKHWCDRHQDLCCTICALRVHRECVLQSIPDPVVIKDTLELLHSQLMDMEQEADNYRMEH